MGFDKLIEDLKCELEAGVNMFQTLFVEKGLKDLIKENDRYIVFSLWVDEMLNYYREDAMVYTPAINTLELTVLDLELWKEALGHVAFFVYVKLLLDSEISTTDFEKLYAGVCKLCKFRYDEKNKIMVRTWEGQE